MDEYVRLTKAILFAVHAHGTRTDRGGQPFIGHPLRVMAALAQPAVPVEVLITAVLHDVCEDEEVTFDLIDREFGESVALAVNYLTRRTANNVRRLFPDLSEDALSHLEETYFDYIRRCRRNPIAKIVKLADLEDNRNPARAGYTESLIPRYVRAVELLTEQDNLSDYQRGYLDGFNAKVKCRTCEGTGQVAFGARCVICNGTGTITRPELEGTTP